MRKFPLTGLEPTLSPVRTRLLLQHSRNCRLDGVLEQEEVSAGEALLLWTAAWLAHRRPVNEEAQELILAQFGAQIVGATVEMQLARQRCDYSKDEAFLLFLNDGTMAGISGLSEFLDLRTGTMRKTLPRPPIESVSCNLSELFWTHLQRLEKGRTPCQATSPPSPPS